MLNRIIELSIQNKFMTILLTCMVVGGGIYSMRNISLDAIPDLSDVQVIIFTEYPGQAPQVVEDQVTYPLSTAMLSVPFSKTVRGYSFFGLSFVYVIFEDGTDMYWARSRVLEYLNFVTDRLPPSVSPKLGPDATGVGWVYEYVLEDTTGQYDLAELRSIQDWYLRYELTSVPGVAEVASIGGFVKQYQVVVDPNKLLAYNIPLQKVKKAIQRSNNDVGGRVIEMGETEYMVRGLGYIESLDDIRSIPVGVLDEGTPIQIKDIATVQLGPELRRGLAEWNGVGEIVGGVVIMRYGENALAVIERIKERLSALESGLPEGVVLRTAYDRSGLINRAIDNLQDKLIEEILIVALVCIVFLLHFRSAFVAIITLPIGILISFIVMYSQGINANIMSLGGIAIAIGVMVDAAIVITESINVKIENGMQPKDAAVATIQEHQTPLIAGVFTTVFAFLPMLLTGGIMGEFIRGIPITVSIVLMASLFVSLGVITTLSIRLYSRGPVELTRMQMKKKKIERRVQKWYAGVLEYLTAEVSLTY